MNGREEHIDHAIQAMAWELADLFDEHSWTDAEGDTLYVTEEGLEAMADHFGEILPELRGDVYEHFIKELDERGIDYDVTQFGANA